MATRRQGQQDVEERTEVRRPRRAHVVLFNDDYTTFEFVSSLLETVFRKSPAEATQVTLQVHRSGRGVAGTYPVEIAETKVQQVHERARAAGFPLRAAAEET